MRVTTTVALALTTLPAFAQPVTITPDGDHTDWPENTFLAQDNDRYYFRFETPTETSLNTALVPIVFTIRDDDAVVQVTFSPTNNTDENGRRRWGPIVQLGNASQPLTTIDAGEIGLHVTPTHASRTFELTLDANALDGGPIDRVSAFIQAGNQAFATPAEAVAVTAFNTPADTIAGIPVKPTNALRVMAWNTLWDQTTENPAPFDRVFKALRPDVILIQEWDRGDATEDSIAAWFNTHADWALSPNKIWSVEENEAWGVAVVTHHPIIDTAGEDLLAPGTRWDFPVRLAAATIETPAGRFAFGSIHYKCCGALGTEEDRRRILEAEAVNDELALLVERSGAKAAILGGDFNLNGVETVLQLSVGGLDADGTHLEFADPVVTGVNALYTHGYPESRSTRSRLDFISYPDSLFQAHNAFVLETSSMTSSWLNQAGLQPTDSHASDHLPVVVDLVPLRIRPNAGN